MTLRLLTLGRQIIWERTDPFSAQAFPTPPVHYGIDDAGFLRWYRMLADDDPDYGGFPAWGANSGNAIGNGWGAITWLGLGDYGVLAAIKEDGGLYLYRYTGKGEDDPGASTGWSSESGTKIADGWGDFVHVAVALNHTQEEGLDDVSFMAVDRAGDMYWYAFGTQDGAFGLQPGSGRKIGNGWAQFQHVAVAPQAVFAVMPNGDLRWYGYNYRNRDFVSWKTNSGNVIGNGWNGLSHLVAAEWNGDFIPPDFDYLPKVGLTSVSETGEVLSHSYQGTGVADPGGHVGWGPRSGSGIESIW
ncbi:MAG: hypothetical protein QOH54_5135 [Mycobacterium sp.]|jgi:hypothetical protein|nr:hypothetical protein [Mycobacterium sp.]MDT5129491.1 hypothetical protein [Mycobacterium sp.]MDT5292841.1 hypothetical protein [Mycobacterium sp.]MDT5358778.1 hypothetical protein [Mycobacterium sp.]